MLEMINFYHCCELCGHIEYEEYQKIHESAVSTIREKISAQ